MVNVVNWVIFEEVLNYYLNYRFNVLFRKNYYIVVNKDFEI